jgi:CRISPR-associated endonuclease Cas1 subtype II
MGWRTVVVSSRSKLELKNNYLVIRGDVVKRVFIDEISVIVVENTGSSLTASLLEHLWTKKIAIIFCDKRRNPGAQLIPYYNSHDCSSRVYAQINWDKRFADDFWSMIIKEKIQNQAKVLYKIGKKVDGDLLMSYVDDIQTADCSNREGHAARVYFNALFGSGFTRDDECFVNYALNYGYSIILSVVNREVVSNGHLTQIGIFHHNVFNQFNLSCDLMEPFRPLVDYCVLSLEEHEDLQHGDKMAIIDLLNNGVYISSMRNTVLNALGIYVKSALEALDKQDSSLVRFACYEF